MKKLIILITLLNFNIVKADYICTINKKTTGMIKYIGKTHDESMLKTVNQCYNILKDNYSLKNEVLTIDLKIFYLEYCLNKVFCKKVEK